MIFRILWRPTHMLGRVQAWLAREYRQDPRSAFAPLFLLAWVPSRLVFIGLFWVCEAVS